MVLGRLCRVKSQDFVIENFILVFSFFVTSLVQRESLEMVFSTSKSFSRLKIGNIFLEPLWLERLLQPEEIENPISFFLKTHVQWQNSIIYLPSRLNKQN